MLLLAALPLPQLDTQHSSSTLEAVHAQSDIGAYLQRIDVLRETPLSSDVDPGASSAFIQLAWPWLQTTAAVDLPQTLEPPDGVLAGLIAAGAGAQGTFRSVAGDFSVPLLRDIGSAEPIPAWGASDDSADALLAQHVCVFAPQPGGWALQSDVTLSSQEALALRWCIAPDGQPAAQRPRRRRRAGLRPQRPGHVGTSAARDGDAARRLVARRRVRWRGCEHRVCRALRPARR